MQVRDGSMPPPPFPLTDKFHMVAKISYALFNMYGKPKWTKMGYLVILLIHLVILLIHLVILLIHLIILLIHLVTLLIHFVILLIHLVILLIRRISNISN